MQTGKASKPKRQPRYVLLGVVGLVVAGAIISAIDKRSHPEEQTTMPAPTNSTSDSDPRSSTGNLLNDLLLLKPPIQQAKVLGKAVGEGCRGKTAFYMGTGHSGLADRMSYWSVACRNGKTYTVQLSPNDKNNQVMECPLFYAVTRERCFERIPGTDN